MAQAYASVPGFVAYRPAIEALRRRRDRVLGPEAERVLALTGDNLWAAIDLNELPSAVERAFQALVSELPLPAIVAAAGDEVALTFANYGRFRASENRDVRRRAVDAMFGTLRGFENTFAATLGGQAQLDVAFARARGYDTALEAYLDKDDLDPAVYRNLVDTVRDHVPALHRYVDLRRRVIGLDEVHIYDLYVPLVEAQAREMTYPVGAETILKALQPLGDGYIVPATRLIDPSNGAVDVYPSKRKESGAFSSSVYGVHPFIKMNFQDSYDDVSTLAHELGHAMHTHLTNANQPYLSSRYTMVLAEVASTCNEMLLSRYMLDNARSGEEKAWLLSELAEGIRQTIYRQTLFAEFELRLHELVETGEPVTADALNAIYADLIRFYYGPDLTIGPDDALEWAYIPHFYYKYYVYSYATGMASAIDIAQRVAAGESGAADAYIEMLSSGNSKPPIELLKGAGVDLTGPAPIASALEYFDRVVSELEELLIEDSQ
jgi:oligoendopeptidase F